MARAGSAPKPLAFAAFYQGHGKNGVGLEHTLGGDQSLGLPTMLLAQGAKCRGSGRGPGGWAGLPEQSGRWAHYPGDGLATWRDWMSGRGISMVLYRPEVG